MCRRPGETRTNKTVSSRIAARFSLFFVSFIFEFDHANNAILCAHDVYGRTRVSPKQQYTTAELSSSYILYRYTYIARVYSRRGELISIGVWPRPSFSCSCTPPHTYCYVYVCMSILYFSFFFPRFTFI